MVSPPYVRYLFRVITAIHTYVLAEPMRNRRLILPARLGVVAMMLGMTLSACYPVTSSLETEDFDAVITLFDPNADFGALRTYALPDSVVHLADGSTVNRLFDALILSEVEANMNALGFTRIAEPDDDNPADVYILVAVTSSDWVGYTEYAWDPYWGWYPYWPCCYGGGWGIYYPWYPTTGIVYTYSTGSILVDMIDPSRADANSEQLPSIWLGVLNGLVADSQQNNADRISQGIDQMFNQSPYLAGQ